MSMRVTHGKPHLTDLHGSKLGRHKTASVGHDCNQRHLAQVCRLARHIGPGDDVEAGTVCNGHPVCA